MRKRRHDKYVCGDCFDDEGLRQFCARYAESHECDFCGETGSEPIAAPFDEVIRHINGCVHMHYDDPANAGLPYETAEGGYQGATYDTDEVLEALGLDFPRDKDDRLRNAVAEGLDNTLWSDAEPFALTSDQQLRFSWERFCRIIKHERRYFFLHDGEEKPPHYRDELLAPARMLGMIFSFAEDAGAFVPLPAGSRIHRARYQPGGEHYATAGTLGPPPLSNAIQTNRMSPPGVVMMYASEDRDTALAETANGPGTFALGEFAIERDLLILDLTRLPPIPTPFAELPDAFEYDPRPRLRFLYDVSRDISRPIARDDRVHIEYVPTQVVTEYVRTAVRIDGRKVDGIRYRSSRESAKQALVLFADQSNLILEKPEQPEFYREDQRWLRLVKASLVKVKIEDMVRWRPEPRVLWFEDSFS